MRRVLSSFVASMSMVGSLALLGVLAFAVGAVVASAAMAEDRAEQQIITNGKCIEPNGLAEWAYTENACKTASSTNMGKWEFEEAVKKGFTSKSGEGIFEAGTNKIICKKDEDSGKLVGLESLEAVKVTFKECKGEETTTKATCTVKSTTATGAEEIVTNELRGELGEVAKSEAESEVGLLLEPVKEPFVTLVGSCLSPKESAVEGALIGEVKPINTLSETSEVKFLAPTSGTQKIKTIERSLAKHCAGAPVARECKEDAVVKATLKAFGATSVSEETTDTNKFEEKLEVRPGL